MIVVTGGAGFIGSNIARGLNRSGVDRIIIVDDLRGGHKHVNLADVRFADYIDKDDFLHQLDKLPKVDAVFHQGACAVTTETDGRFMMHSNFDYSKRLLHFCERREIPFVYASSAAVYGLGSNGFAEKRENEFPLNVYGFSKLTFDNYVRDRLGEFPAPVVGLRYFNVYGRGEAHKGSMASIAYKLFDQYRTGEPLTLFAGSDGFNRDFIYVDDVVDVNLYFMKSDRSGIFNVGTGIANSFDRLGSLVKTSLQGADFKYVPMPENLVGQYQAYTCSDNRALRAAGYNASFTSLGDGIEKYIGWLADGTRQK